MKSMFEMNRRIWYSYGVRTLYVYGVSTEMLSLRDKENFIFSTDGFGNAWAYVIHQAIKKNYIQMGLART